jgi:hypothetical protein
LVAQRGGQKSQPTVRVSVVALHLEFRPSAFDQ